MWHGTYSLTSTPSDRFFEKLFHCRFIYSQSFCQKSAERKSQKKYFVYEIFFFLNIFIFSFWSLTLDTKTGSTSNKATHHLLDHGNFKNQHYWQIVKHFRGSYICENYLYRDALVQFSIQQDIFIERKCQYRFSSLFI